MIIRIIIAILFIFITTHAQWEWLNPLPQGNWLTSITTTSDGDIWTVGLAGTILQSSDNGLTWNTIEHSRLIDLNDIYISEADEIFICGENGYIIKSNDNGITWDELPTETNNDITKIIEHDNSLWAVGDSGYIGKSIDRGLSWQTKQSITIGKLENIMFSSPDVGWAVSSGWRAELLSTEDGGETWQIKQNLYLVAGYEWTTDVHFFNDQIGIVTGFSLGGSSVIKTEDGGNNWITLYDDFHGSPIDLDVVDSLTWYVAGSRFGDGAICKTTDAGESWDSVHAVVPHVLSHIMHTPNGDLWSVGTGGAITSYQANANEWIDYTYHLIGNIQAGYKYDNGHWWFSGDPGKLLKTTNAGDTWEEIIAPTEQYINDIHFQTQNIGVVAGGNEYAAKTTDAGSSWSNISINQPLWLEEIFFWNEQNGIISCSDQYFVTHDGGNSWLENSITQNDKLVEIDEHPNGDIWACSSQGKLYKYDKNTDQFALVYDFAMSQCRYKISKQGYHLVWELYGTILKISENSTNWTSYYLPDKAIEVIQLDEDNFAFISKEYRIFVHNIYSGVTIDMNVPTSKVYLQHLFFANESIIAYGSDAAILATPIITTSLEDNYKPDEEQNDQLQLGVYPNPFNSSTVIKFALPVTSNVKLTIYNMTGQEINTLSADNLSAGTQQLTWNGTNKNNELVSSGIYIYRIQAVGNDGRTFSKSAKMTLLK